MNNINNEIFKWIAVIGLIVNIYQLLFKSVEIKKNDVKKIINEIIKWEKDQLLAKESYLDSCWKAQHLQRRTNRILSEHEIINAESRRLLEKYLGLENVPEHDDDLSPKLFECLEIIMHKVKK